MATVYIGIGSNLGNRKKNIEDAIVSLRKNRIRVLKRSTIIETDPIGGPPNQGKFLNGVLKIQTQLAPQKLLHLLKQIERELGRKKTILNGPRSIDLDILLYDHLKLQTPQLTLPHPRMFKRHFVMNPLKEIEPLLTEELSHAYC
ncbi:MAG: 2-amino-4-hydroxy-6-hydroxymethyldihydropteridine diphosphokinase [Candidatus Omnitrophica bacterium]|nr:2-amino-4-hydroxy-6-hydroxymethyldihydropteridine diphosphokinase [Candidatus Omnitrophota bacterium]MCK5083946.1 2-amino-4-hydroxy-6-hydroxymethyldihydropteridine diphosphokinase [Candidatus Omnitrophota bacterium]